MIVYVYDIKTLELIAKPIAEDYESFKNNPTKLYPKWDTKNNLASEVEFQNPILEGETIRDKTRDELILLDNKIELLEGGEHIENNKIIKTEAPSYLFKKIWNKENNMWEEGATQEEVNIEINKLINEYVGLAEQKEKWEKYGFETFEIENKMAENILQRNYLLAIFQED